MPSISYNGQSFAIDGRRIWVLGASIQYARVPAALWAARIAAAKQAGFNTIETACPWSIHEPRSGRFEFQGNADVRRFLQACGSAGMRVILRVGPYIGSHFDGGGLPGWLIEMPDIQLRQNNQLFLEHTSRYFRRLLSEVADLQITAGGPILLVQSEHAWTCSNETQGETYLHDVTRFIREAGITVPLLNSNDLYQESPGTIDTWRGYNNLLPHLRQLRTLQLNAPRVVSSFVAADVELWGGNGSGAKRQNSKQSKAGKSPGATLRHLAEVFASGAQPVVSPFHAGTNFDFLGGRIAGCPGGFVATAAALDPPLGEAGTRGVKYHAIRRLITFANHFSHVFAELEPDYQPIVLDPESIADAESQEDRGVASVVPLRGPQGRIVFVFGDDCASGDGTAMLVLDDGIRLPVHLGDQPVGWYALDVDLQGVGRLDYSNICPWAMIDRSIVVFQGPARAPVFISIGGTPLEVAIPADETKPLVVEHKGLTIVVCNQTQIDAAYHDDSALYVGINGFDANGAPVRDERFAKAYIIKRNADIQAIAFDGTPNHSVKNARKPARRGAPDHALPLADWQASPATAYVSGESPRFASLDGPETLSACGAPSGYGWYRIVLSATGKKQCHAPQAADRLHLFLNGKRQQLIGVGPGAQASPFDLRFGKGEQTLVALVDNLGRFSEGNDLGQRKGLWGHIYEVKQLRLGKPKMQASEPVNPFELRGFIAGRDASVLSDTWQVVWTFAHSRKTPLLIDVTNARCSGTFVLNDEPIAYYAGATGACFDRIVLDPKEVEAFKRGKNILRFAPDLHQEDPVAEITKAATIYECATALTSSNGSSASGTWAFAKWEPPAVATYDTMDKSQMRTVKGLPCWWRTTFDVSADTLPSTSVPFWLDVSSMSKGQAFINGEDLGRYFTATATGKKVGPQTRLYVPTPWLKMEQNNELVVFDEHGCDPAKVALIQAAEEMPHG